MSLFVLCHVQSDFFHLYIRSMNRGVIIWDQKEREMSASYALSLIHINQDDRLHFITLYERRYVSLVNNIVTRSMQAINVDGGKWVHLYIQCPIGIQHDTSLSIYYIIWEIVKIFAHIKWLSLSSSMACLFQVKLSSNKTNKNAWKHTRTLHIASTHRIMRVIEY